MKTLKEAAQDVCTRWDSPMWRESMGTSVFISELKQAIEREEAQTVKSAAAKGCGDCFLQDCDYPNCMPTAKGGKPQPAQAAPRDECDSPALCSINGSCAGQYCTKKACDAPRVPMTPDQIKWLSEYQGIGVAQGECLIEAVEKFHKIGVKP